MAKSKGASAFAGAITKKAGKNWKGKRKIKDPFGEVTVPEDNYTCTLSSASVGETKNKDPYLRLGFTIVEGDYEGTVLPIFHMIKETKKQTIDDALERMFVDLQRIGIDTEELDPDALDEILQKKVKAEIAVEISVSQGTRGPRKFVNINGLIDPETSSGDGDDEGETSSDSEDEGSDDEWTFADIKALKKGELVSLIEDPDNGLDGIDTDQKAKDLKAAICKEWGLEE